MSVYVLNGLLDYFVDFPSEKKEEWYESSLKLFLVNLWHILADIAPSAKKPLRKPVIIPQGFRPICGPACWPEALVNGTVPPWWNYQ